MATCRALPAFRRCADALSRPSGFPIMLHAFARACDVHVRGRRRPPAGRRRGRGARLLNAKTNQIEYYYASRLPGEPLEGRPDPHLHPVAPSSVLLTLTGPEIAYV